MASHAPRLPTSATGKTALAVARRCARVAAAIIMGGLGSPQQRQVRFKGRGNIVTPADIEAERAILDILAAEYPGHAVLSEETASVTEADPGSAAMPLGWLWVVDPLDGTRNYASGIPSFCVNVALCYCGEPLLALTYEPARREEFLARKGGGTFVNGRLVQASGKESVKASVLAFDMGYDDGRAQHMLALINALWPGMQSLRIPGSAALGLAYAACGRYDLFVHHYLFPWDVAAGILLVREAGGTITDRDGGPIAIHSHGVIAGGPRVHADFLRLAQ
ncbi:MAG: inositol monophosphatase family protein, partial [Dehalococcoidia bacterium]